jgi:hypothetical protein
MLAPKALARRPPSPQAGSEVPGPFGSLFLSFILIELADLSD